MSGTTALLILAALLITGLLYAALRWNYRLHRRMAEADLRAAVMQRLAEDNRARIDRGIDRGIGRVVITGRPQLRLVATGRSSGGMD